MKNLLLFAFLCSTFFINKSHSQSHEECASGQIHQRLMQSDPEYALQIQANEALIKHLQNTTSHNKSSSVLEIPIVVHVIHTGQSLGTGANISMTQINSAIDTLNARYRNQHGSSIDVEIEFVLAKRDPDGNATTGVVRIDGSSVTNYATEGITAGNGSGAVEADVKALSRWPNSQYYNVWVVTEIEDNDGLFGIQGYAYFPGASPEVDGTVIMNTCFGTSGTVNSFNNRNRTFVHEMGHAFNLYHTFQGDADGTICPSGNGDFVADTDPHIRAASNCPSGTNSCTGGSIDELTENYMNYSSQSCAVKFTSGQSSRIRAAILASRPSLTTSLGGTLPASNSVTAASCTPTTNDTNNAFGFGIYEFNFSNVHVVSDGAVDEVGYVDQTQHQTISLKSDTSYAITIETGSANNEDVEVYIDYNNDGDFLDSGENVFSSSNSISHSGIINIPDTGITTGSLIRLRVIGDWFNNNITDACYNPTYGQAEDYAVFIESPAAPLSVSINKTNVSCHGVADGSVTAIVAGGSIPYTYSWNDGSTSATANNLTANTYTITVTDAGGTTVSGTTTVNQPFQLASTLVTTDETCAGNDGSINAIVSGGTSPYTYSWDNSLPSTNMVNGLTAGTYFLTVSDANGCDLIDIAQIIEDCTFSPQNLISKFISDTSVTLNWDIVAGAGLYKILWRPNTESLWSGRYVKNIPNGRLDLDTLQPGTKYFWAVRAYIPGSGWSAFSSIENFTTMSGPCIIPTGLFSDAITDTRVRLNWMPKPNSLKYRIRYRAVGNSNWEKKIAQGNRNKQFINYLSSNTNYEWQIKSVCVYGPSFGTRWSSMQTFTTNASARIKSLSNLSEALVSGIYPNPNMGNFTIGFAGEYQNIWISISDLSGKLVYENTFQPNSAQIDVSTNINESGVYLMKIRTNEKTVVKRLVIQR